MDDLRADAVLHCPHCEFAVTEDGLRNRRLLTGELATIWPPKLTGRMTDHVLTEHPDRPRRRTH